MRKGVSMKKNMHKMLLCFTSNCAEILLHILGYSFCTERQVLAHFYQMLFHLKGSKIICAKAAMLWHQICC
jgi:hypothetical protein